MINISKLWLAAALATAFVGASARAEPAASTWSQTDQTEVRLVAATSAVGEAESLRLGLHFKMAPGWKIYWRSPGDAGLPPRLDWSGSRNLDSAAISWPVPERFELFGLDTFGYGDEVVLPLAARLQHKGEPLDLHLAVDYLVCEKICIPYQAAFTLDLPAGPAQPSDYAHLIDRFVARVPGDGARAGLSLDAAMWNGGAHPSITVVASATTPFGPAPDVFVEGADGPLAGVSFGRPEVTRTDGGRRVELRTAVHADPATAAKLGSLAGTPVTLTLVDGMRAAEIKTTLAPGIASPSPIDIGFGAVLGIALLGGLILNLMPCVLPVLALKLLSVVGHAGGTRAHIRRNFIASAAGILASFALLAAGLVALKLAGATVGWGIQFQQPAFLVLMALILVLFTANLWGWFEIRLPGRVADRLAAPRAPHEETALGAFFSGAFATLLATPCSAPFVGTAVGFALARGPLEIVAVFLVLGLGLALPYLAVALVPAMAAHLPRPGRWMLHLRAILGVALLVTVAWLLSVLDAQTGAAASGATGGLLLILLALLWSMHEAEGVRRGVSLAGVAVLVALTIATPLRLMSEPPAPATGADKEQGGLWRKFDLAAIGTLVDQGQVVFVDVTADWCITCQVNKAAVLSRGEVASRLGEGDVVAMKADWTRPDETIARYLASFGRYGIPFNVVYGPGARAGIALPELLTSDAVLAALDKAHGPAAAESHAEARPQSLSGENSPPTR